MSERTAVDRAANSGDDREAVISVSDLTYTYPKADEPAVRDVSFEVAAGEIFGFLGPSGAGKSTTQRILVGLLDGYGGRASVLGTEVADHGGDYYERVGISSETPNHYRKLTGRENLELFASLYAGETRDPAALLSMVGLADAADRRVSAYSKGMEMRLTFARALLHDPDLLFLDEPTNGLDPGNARTIKDVVLDLREAGTTVFVTTHDMGVADQLCDRVAFMVDGRVPIIDAPKALKLAHGTRRVRVEARRNGRLETAEFDLDSLGRNDEFAALVRGGVETIHTEEATLEDVFLAVTGTELR